MKITEVEIVYNDCNLEERINNHIRWREEDGWIFKDLKSSNQMTEGITILIFEKEVETNEE